MMSKRELVPELRFPEFKNDGEWKTEPFNDVYSFKITNSFSRDKLNYEKGNVKNIHYGDIHTKFSSHFDIAKEKVPYINSNISIERIDEDNYCIEGDVIIADASEDIDDIGKSIEIVNLNNEKLLAGLHTFLARPIDSKIKSGFGGHLFKSNVIRTQIKKEAQGAKVLGISKGRLANLDIYYPDNPKEQQKIANCLSSLDGLISGETAKLEVLKEHKKGLMQQLFPREN
jgi:type I restriction enzyme S subunit